MAYGFHVHPKEYTADVRGFSFVIERDGDLYKAYKSGKGLTFEDDDASEVIQSAVDNAGYGKVLLRQATYLITTPIVLRDGTYLEGESGYVVLKAGTSLDRLIDARDVGSIYLRNLKLDGDDKTTVGIDMNQSSSAWKGQLIENVTILRCSDGIYEDNCDGVFIRNSRIHCGRSIYSPLATGLTKIEGGALQGTTAALDVCGGATNREATFILIGVEITCVKPRGAAHIFLDSCFCEGTTAVYGLSPNNRVFIMNCKFWKSGSYPNINGGDFGYLYIRNTLLECDTGTYNVRCSSGIIDYDGLHILGGGGIDPANFKFLKNSGVATFSGDGSATDFEIGAHGLATTDPEKIVVKVTPVSDDAIAASPCVGYVDPADNTKIRVKFASAPASGTDNVKIKWYAWVE